MDWNWKSHAIFLPLGDGQQPTEAQIAACRTVIAEHNRRYGDGFVKGHQQAPNQTSCPGPVVLDLFADMSNALVGCFYTAADNALLQDWAGDSRRQGGACFANPPYSRPESDADGNAIVHDADSTSDSSTDNNTDSDAVVPAAVPASPA